MAQVNSAYATAQHLRQHGGDSLSSCMTRLMFWVKRKNKLVVNAKQLRASVIVKWLKMYNLRKAQYLAGHRYISSTEAY